MLLSAYFVLVSSDEVVLDEKLSGEAAVDSVAVSSSGEAGVIGFKDDEEDEVRRSGAGVVAMEHVAEGAAGEGGGTVAVEDTEHKRKRRRERERREKPK